MISTIRCQAIKVSVWEKLKLGNEDEECIETLPPSYMIYDSCPDYSSTPSQTRYPITSVSETVR